MPQGGAQPLQRPRRPLRHRVHLYAYATVSLALMMMGLIFSGFAIFKRDSEISKIWLAGPTTIAVGLVLCGKVIIDCRPRQSVEDDYGYEEEIADFAPTTEEENEKGLGVISESNHVSKDVSLPYEKYTVVKRNSVHCRNDIIQAREQSDMESEVWNLRDDYPSDGITCTNPIHSKPRNGSLCLLTPSARNVCMEADGTARSRRVHSYCGGPGDRYCSDHTVQCHGACLDRNSKPGFSNVKTSVTPLSRRSRCVEYNEDSPSPLYQGEIFLLNDKQYFI